MVVTAITTVIGRKFEFLQLKDIAVEKVKII